MSFSPVELYGKLKNDESFVEWKKHHPHVFLSHFFCSIDPNFILLSPWDLGMYDPENGKITIFTHLQEGFEIKPADDVFKKEEAKVEELKLGQVKTTLDQADKLFQEHKAEFFPKEIFGNCFIILQYFEGKLMWNITLITKTLKFANMKVNALKNEVLDHTVINFVEKQFNPKDVGKKK